MGIGDLHKKRVAQGRIYKSHSYLSRRLPRANKEIYKFWTRSKKTLNIV